MESSLREYDRPVDRIRQHLQANPHSFLLVEGPDDALTLRAHVDLVHEIFPVGGKKSVAAVGRELARLHIARYLAVIDRDFDVNDEFELAHIPRRMYYEGRDLEAMLIELGTLADLLVHVGSVEKIQKSGGPEQFVSRVRDEASRLVGLKSANQVNSWGLPFDKVRLEMKTDRRSVVIDMRSYCAALLTHLDLPDAPALPELISAEFATPSDNVGPSGKDTVALTGVGLRLVVGGLTLAATRPDVLLRNLRGSCAFRLDSSEWMQQLRFELVSLDAGHL